MLPASRFLLPAAFNAASPRLAINGPGRGLVLVATHRPVPVDSPTPGEAQDSGFRRVGRARSREGRGGPDDRPRPGGRGGLPAKCGMTAGLGRGGGTAAKGDQAAGNGDGAPGGEGPGAQGSAAGVLADRMAAALVHREPGWKLPRRSALARRFNVSVAEIDVAVEELSRRSLLRKLPDGQLYRASPAEYQIAIEGVAGLSTSVDPMGSAIVCQAKHVSRRPAPQDICWALGLAPGTQVRVIRCLWTSGGSPVAMSTAYLPQAPGCGEPAASQVSRGAGRGRRIRLGSRVRRGTVHAPRRACRARWGGRSGRCACQCPGGTPGRAERGAVRAAAVDRPRPAPCPRAVGDHGDHKVRRVVGRRWP